MLANTIVRKVNTRSILELEAAIARSAATATFVGHNWGTVVTGGSSQTNNTGWPAADIANAQFLADTDELGVDLRPLDRQPEAEDAVGHHLRQGRRPGPGDLGIREMYASNRVANGTAYAVASGQVGELRSSSRCAPRPSARSKNEKTLVQSSIRPVMYVTNPYSIKKVTGLDG
jgi:hypothetical protein